MKKRTIVCILLALTMVLGTTAMCYADVGAATVGATRKSNTSASATASATFTNVATSCSVSMTLQEKYNGSWRTATGVSKTSASYSRTSAKSIGLSTTFTLVKGKVYRIKAVFKDTRSGTTWTNTYYSGSF